MASENLFNRIWKIHSVRELPSGQTQLFIGLHLIHEVTSPQAFGMLRDRNLTVMFPKKIGAGAMNSRLCFEHHSADS